MPAGSEALRVVDVWAPEDLRKSNATGRLVLQDEHEAVLPYGLGGDASVEVSAGHV